MHKARQSEKHLQVGEAYHGHDLIYCTALGTPHDRGNVVKRELLPLLKQADLRRIRFHDLRHTFATLLIDQGGIAEVYAIPTGPCFHPSDHGPLWSPLA
jgi:integrase